MTTLNTGQQEAADAFYDFLFQTDREFIISGPAGVGKTWLMRHIVDVVMPRYIETCQMLDMEPEYDNVEITATTNKAAEVLSQATGRPCKTVHSFFNLKVINDYASGETRLEKNKDWKVHERKVIFIDECSMIDTALWEILKEGAINSKLVYVGDHCQLAPVNETLSPIYQQRSPMFKLTEPVRNAGQPALVDLCDRLRTAVETGTFCTINEVPGVIDVVSGPEMQQMVIQEFTGLSPSARILAYTNNRVKDYADFVRGEVRGLPPEYVEGEKLVVGSAYRRGNIALNVEAEVSVYSARKPRLIHIENEVDMEVRSVDLMTRTGMITVDYPTDRDHHTALVKHFKREKKWKRYFALTQEFADLRPADSCTVYKSQGSTYDTVYVDLGNISTCNVPSQVIRQLYVAISRARSRVVLYGDLAPKYGGPVVRA